MMQQEKRKRAAFITSPNLTVSTSNYCSGVPWYQALRVIEPVGAMNSNFWVAVTISESL